MTWAQTTSLELGTGTLDSPVSLFATAVGERFREHLVDGGALSPAQWATLAQRITECTDGRISLDVRRLYRPRPYEPF